MRVISPSLLSANFKNISSEIYRLEKIGVSRLHLDVMDGNFVPSITFGPIIINSINNITKCHLETHLMIKNPRKSFDQFIECGSKTIIFHYEASSNHIDDLIYLRNNNVLSGIALNPDTDENNIIPLLDYLDYVLIMSVYPGKGGQKFINSTLEKMRRIVSLVKDKKIIVGVDGGVNLGTIASVYSTGIDIVIIGSGLFNANDINQRYNDLLSK